MFEKGAYIVYGNTGVCFVSDITTMDMDGIPDDKLFYILRPCGKEDREIFTPVENKKTTMRNIMSAKEAEELLQNISQLEEFEIPREKFREELYKKCIRGCDGREMMKLMKTLHTRKMKRLLIGKHFPATDEKYLKIAQDNLCRELAVSLDKNQEDILKYILEHFKEGWKQKEHS